MSEEEARAINERIDSAVAYASRLSKHWQHPDYPAWTLVEVDESIKDVHFLHPLAGQTARVCHGNQYDYPGVPVSLPETKLYEDCTIGNYSIVPVEYVRKVEA